MQGKVLGLVLLKILGRKMLGALPIDNWPMVVVMVIDYDLIIIILIRSYQTYSTVCYGR